MLNRKVIVGIAVIVLSFVGIFTFALNNNNSNDDPNKNAVNDVSDDDNNGDDQNNNQNNNQSEEENTETVETTRLRTTAIDTTDPVISSVQLSTTEWTKGSVIVTVVASDDTGVTGYSFNGGEWQTNNITNISTNGTVEIRVRDAAGNIATVNQAILNIDITAPTVIFGTNGNSNYAKVASTKVTVNFEGAPIDPASLKYVWTTSTTAPDNSAFDGGNITLDENHTSVISTSTDPRILTAPTDIYYLWILAKDEAGNGEPVRSEAFYLDNTVPTIISVTGNATEWTKQNVTLTVNANDNASLGSKLQYSFDNGTIWQDENTKVFSQIETVKILVKDEAGNISALTTIEINKIDKIAPQTIVEVPEEGKFLKGTEVKVKVTSTDNMELATIVANLYSSNGTRIKSTTRSVMGTSAVHEYDFSSLNLADGKYYIKANAYDKAGTISNTVTRNFVVDSTKPTLKVNLNRLSYLTSGTPVRKTAIPEFEGYDENLLKVVIYKENGTVQSEATTTAKERRAKVTHLTDGKYTIIAYDKAGNESEPFVLIMDSTAPTVPSFDLNGYNEDWTKENIFISLSSSDAYSGVLTHQMRYNDEATWYDVGNGVTFANTYNMTVQFRSVDKAGNVSEPTRKIVIKQDKINPTVPSFDLNGYNEEWTKENIFISLSSSDANSGVLTHQMRYNDEATWYDVGNGVTFANTYNMTVQFRSVDKAGNVSEPTRKIVIKQDQTLPTVPNFDLNGYNEDWTKENIFISLSSSDAHSGVLTHQMRYNDEATWYDIGNGVTFANTYNMTVQFRSVDKVGNVSEPTRKIIIKQDNDTPTIPTVDFNGYVPGTWTNQTVNVTLNSTDGGSGVDKYQDKHIDFDWWYSDVVGNVFSVSGTSIQTWAFRAVDKVGHTSASTASYQILVDKINPYVQYTNDSNHTTYMSNHTVNVLVAGGNGQSPLDLSNTKYLWSKDASGIDSDDFAANGQNFSITNNYANISGTTDMDGIYYLWIMTKDTAGNLTIVPSAAYYFDNMDPTISIDGETSIEIELGSNFNLMTDIVANDSSNQFNVTHSDVDLSTIGIKTVVYTVTDSVGRTASVTRTINVVDTTDPQAHFGNLVYNASYTRIGHLFKNATATYEVNIIDYGNLAVLKYVWMPAGLEQGETLWNAAWLLSKDFNNNAQISQDFGALTYSSKWKLWIYAKDASGNDVFASTDEIEIK